MKEISLLQNQIGHRKVLEKIINGLIKIDNDLKKELESIEKTMEVTKQRLQTKTRKILGQLPNDDINQTSTPPIIPTQKTAKGISTLVKNH